MLSLTTCSAPAKLGSPVSCRLLAHAVMSTVHAGAVMSTAHAEQSGRAGCPTFQPHACSSHVMRVQAPCMLWQPDDGLPAATALGAHRLQDGQRKDVAELQVARLRLLRAHQQPRGRQLGRQPRLHARVRRHAEPAPMHQGASGQPAVIRCWVPQAALILSVHARKQCQQKAGPLRVFQGLLTAPRRPRARWCPCRPPRHPPRAPSASPATSTRLRMRTRSQLSVSTIPGDAEPGSMLGSPRQLPQKLVACVCMHGMWPVHAGHRTEVHDTGPACTHAPQLSMHARLSSARAACRWWPGRRGRRLRRAAPRGSCRRSCPTRRTACRASSGSRARSAARGTPRRAPAATAASRACSAAGPPLLSQCLRAGAEPGTPLRMLSLSHLSFGSAGMTGHTTCNALYLSGRVTGCRCRSQKHAGRTGRSR